MFDVPCHLIKYIVSGLSGPWCYSSLSGPRCDSSLSGPRYDSSLSGPWCDSSLSGPRRDSTNFRRSRVGRFLPVPLSFLDLMLRFLMIVAKVMVFLFISMAKTLIKSHSTILCFSISVKRLLLTF